MLYIGDKVFYPSFGAGTVIGTEEKEVYGDINKYYIIKLTNEIITMVPVDTRKSKGIRACISEEKCVKALEELKKPYNHLPYKWLDRYKIYTKVIKEGDFKNMWNTLRDILGLKKTKKLSKSEEKFFQEILNFTSDEISIVLGLDINKVKALIVSGKELNV